MMNLASGSGPMGNSNVRSSYGVEDPAFTDHVRNLRGTMFYVCQGSCLCGTVNNRGKIIYCYGDLVPRHGELFAENGENNGGASSKDLLAAQLGLWAFGILALLIVLLLIRKSIASLRRHLERVTDRLPMYHDDEEALSTNSTSSPTHTQASSSKDQKETNLDHVVGDDLQHNNHHGAHPQDLMMTTTHLTSSEDHHDTFSEDGTLTPDPDMMEESPIHIGIQRLTSQSKGVPVEQLRKMRLQRKDFKKGGEALRGKNVTENFRVKEKDIKRTMK